MSLKRLKILTAITVPAGGWDLKFYLSNIAQYDKPCTATIPAGTYFMAADNQDDDFYYQLQVQMNAAAQAGWPGCAVYISAGLIYSSHKSMITFEGADASGNPQDDIKLAWTESDEGVYEALGFDGSSDDASTTVDEPSFTSDWHHAYGFYCDEDGQAADLQVEDANLVTTLQATSLSGKTKSLLLGDRYANKLALQFLERNYLGRTKVFSGGVAYTDAPVRSYKRNEPLECWWMAARSGTRFRVYYDSRENGGQAVYGNWIGGGAVVLNTSTPAITEAAAAWTTNQYAGFVASVPNLPGTLTQSWVIASNTGTVLTLANTHPVARAVSVGYWIYDWRYQTYVIDMEAMREFRPVEMPGLDRYSITIPLKRYV